MGYEKCVEVRVICCQGRPWRPYLQKLLRKIRKIPRLTRVLKSKIALRAAFARFSKMNQCAYLGICKTRFLVLWCSATKTRVKQGFFRILSEMFCKSLPKSAVAAPRQRGIRLRATPSCTRHRAAYDTEPLACQAIPTIKLFLMLAIFFTELVLSLIHISEPTRQVR